MATVLLCHDRGSCGCGSETGGNSKWVSPNGIAENLIAVALSVRTSSTFHKLPIHQISLQNPACLVTNKAECHQAPRIGFRQEPASMMPEASGKIERHNLTGHISTDIEENLNFILADSIRVLLKYTVFKELRSNPCEQGLLR